MTPRVSIILPSRHEDALRGALANIEETTRGEYEVILVAPEAMIVGREGSYQGAFRLVGDEKGPVRTQALGVRYTRGEFVVAHADDARYTPGWDDAAVVDYEAREALYAADARFSGQPYVMGLRFGLLGTAFGMYYANFPFVRRATIATLGWYDPDFTGGFADIDLSIRAWDHGGVCEFSEAQLLEVVTEIDQRKKAKVADPGDADLFVRRWAPRYGQGWDTSRLDGYNVNLRPTADILENRTVRCNSSTHFDERLRRLSPPRLVEMQTGANLVLYAGWLWRVPMRLGAIDLEDDAQRKTPGITRHALSEWPS